MTTKAGGWRTERRSSSALPFSFDAHRFLERSDGAKVPRRLFERFPRRVVPRRHVELTDTTPHHLWPVDAVLNPAVCRIGTAEIYRQVGASTRSSKASRSARLDERCARGPVGAAAGRPHARRRPADRIRKTFAKTPRRGSPGRVVQVTDIPRTKSGKIVELAGAMSCTASR